MNLAPPTDGVIRVQCWSGPRNISTALMYSWRQRADTTVYDEPEPANEDNVPPVTVMSPTTKSVAAFDKVNVNVDVSPDFNKVELAVIEIVGA